MKKVSLQLFVTALIFFGLNATASHLKDNLLMSAKLSGDQEVPAVSTKALGVATFMLNASRDTLCVKISATGLSGPITGIHIHEGDFGTNGNVLIDLTPFVSGNQVNATLTGMDVSTLNISKYLSGKCYVNLHTLAHPGGEIRGQMYLETDWSFVAQLDGDQEVPAVITNAYGVGTFNLSKDLSKINFNVVVQDLSGPIIGAHLHWGGKGMAGGVAENLTAVVSGNVISGTILLPSPALIDSIMASKIYLNVHTAANPGGEIRGQLMNQSRFLYFDATLNGSQEVPPISTVAMGAASMMLSSTFDTLWYDISTDGLSGPITGVHFHNAMAGVNGGVEVNLMSGINGNRISGMLSGGSLTKALINKFLRGEIYVNVHTSANSGGEIRGQVYRLAREGYVFALSGSQEVPMISTPAIGSGMVSIDRDQDNAHFMLVSNGLMATGLHFHKAVMGQNGGVLFNLTPFYMDNAASGYWKSSDASPFTTQNSLQFRSDSVYVNIHTAANPNGEIRGQVMGGFKCAPVTPSSARKMVGTNLESNLYPNPVFNHLNFEFNSAENSNINLVIIDLMGKEIIKKNFQIVPGRNTMRIDLNGLQSGVHFLKIQNGTQFSTQKFIKN